MTHGELHNRNSACGQVGDHSAVVQLHHVLAATALAALALLGWRYFSGAGRRGAGG